MTTNVDLGVPESIERDKFVGWLRELGIDPNKSRSIRMDHKGIYAEMFAMTPEGRKILNHDRPAINSIFVRFSD